MFIIPLWQVLVLFAFLAVVPAACFTFLRRWLPVRESALATAVACIVLAMASTF